MRGTKDEIIDFVQDGMMYDMPFFDNAGLVCKALFNPFRADSFSRLPNGTLEEALPRNGL